MSAICLDAESKSNERYKKYKVQIYALIYEFDFYKKRMEDEYDVNGYTDEQLFQILDLNNPSDRELEAKTLSMVRKYANFGNPSGDKLSQFFIDIYNRFFENDDTDADANTDTNSSYEVKEGFQSSNSNANTFSSGANITRPYNKGPELSIGSGINTYLLNNSTGIGNAFPENIPVNNIFALPPDLFKSNVGVIGEANVGNKVTPSEDNVKLTKTLDYTKDKLNPLLKQTIKRIISIDSQYRNTQTNSPSTNFTFNLSEPLRDVVSLSLYSIQIPFTWYTVNSDFGGNFFYLKGNAPGINNGLHDYKISIASGNYNPSRLASVVNDAINEMKLRITDVSFGQTQVIYNNGSSDPNSGTGKCKLIIDITKIFNESNYSLKFPIWSTPTDSVLRIQTLAGYLGLNEQEYYCSSIYSYPFFSTAITSTSYSINTSKTSFFIVPYVGTNFLNADISYNLITINTNLSGFTTIPNAVSIMNTALKTNSYLDPEFSGCTLVDISNNLQTGNGHSYVKLNCKLKNSYAPVVKNLKLAALFPYDQVEGRNTSLFYGSVSIFAFSSSINYRNEYIVCEFNELLAETPILQSSYDSSNTSLTFRCDLPGYDNSYNNINASLNPGTNPLNSFIQSVNTAIQSSVNLKNNTNFNGESIRFYSDITTNNLVFQTNLTNSFYNSDYSIYATIGACNLPEIFGLPTTLTPINTNIFNNTNYTFNSVSFSQNDRIYIVPTGNGNKYANTFIIDFYKTGAYSNGAELAAYFTSKITTFKDDVTETFPFAGSIVTYAINGGFSLELNIETTLNQSKYSLILDSSNDVWKRLTFYDVSSTTQTKFTYDINDYSNNSYKIESKMQIKDNEITIFDGSNDTFFLSPSNTVDVFNTSSDKYKITIKIPDTNTNDNGTTYSINELLAVINAQFTNSIAAGTVCSLFDLPNGQTIVKFRFNINTVFTTKDYNLVFYDPYSFTSCFSNNSKKTTTSIQNATWDTTLGWLLGYRNAISYTLSEYTNTFNTLYATDSFIYYLYDNTNVCVLMGDTNVSTNLYNYFLIMLDDYVQNHLNDGLVTITNQETSVNHGPYVNVCDPVTGQTISRPANYGNPGITYTAQELYAFNQQVQSQLVKAKSYSKGPFVKDVFGIIPVKTPGAIGNIYVEFGGSMQNQQRLYFGPVNIHRMTIQLLNDRGNLVDLNSQNWSFSFICEQLYKSGVS